MAGKNFNIYGLTGSGKSECLKAILRSQPLHLVYDYHKEYDPAEFNRFRPSYYKQPEIFEEMQLCIDRAVIPPAKAGRLALFAVDEAHRYFPNAHPLIEGMADLAPNHRHWNLTLGFITQRPAMLNTTCVELAHWLFVYRLAGKNDLQRMADIAQGLDDAVRGLGQFEYVLVAPDRTFQKCPPLPI